MRRLRRIALFGLSGIAGIALVLVVVVQLRWDRRFNVALVPLAASRDTQALARGRYLVYGPAHCAGCHRSSDDTVRLSSGAEPPLAGGNAFRIPPGTFFVPNITPDLVAGIGRRSDAELARTLRHGVRADGRAALPFMAYQNMSDEDVIALLSFLRAQPAVPHAVPPHEVNLVGKAVFAFVIAPIGPEATPPARTPVPGSIEYGAYLANAVAQCAGCHTKRSLVDGSFQGPRFAGGTEFPVEDDPKLILVTPNLTPDSATGRIAAWSEDQFVARFRQGPLLPQSNMPWSAFTRMTDGDLRAIFRYLHTLAPVHNDPGPSLRAKT